MPNYSYGSLGTKSIYIDGRSGNRGGTDHQDQIYEGGGGPGRPDLSTELILLLLGGIAAAAGIGWAWSQNQTSAHPPGEDGGDMITRVDYGNHQTFMPPTHSG